MLEVKNLDIAYGQHQALSKVSIQIQKGEIVVILGANGAGKSSLIRTISGMCEGQVDGEIAYNGQSLLGLNADQIVNLGIALVPEGRAIFGDMTVEENLKLGAYPKRARERQTANLERVFSLFPKLQERKKQVSRTMSGGEQQMVAVGRAMMSDPAILMLDEPSLGLSPLLSKELFQSLGQIGKAGLGVLIVEQNAKLSLKLADRGYLIENGVVVGADTASNLMSDPAVQAAYLGKRKSSENGLKKAQTVFATEVATTTANHAPPAQGLLFIQPAGVNSAWFEPEPILHEPLVDLVERASNVSKTQTSLTSKIVHKNLPSHPTGLAADTASSTTGVHAFQSQIDSLLADMEQTAQRTRTAKPENNHQHKRALVGLDAEDYQNLPHIPVYKKNRIKIYTRNQAGRLVKSKEV